MEEKGWKEIDSWGRRPIRANRPYILRSDNDLQKFAEEQEQPDIYLSVRNIQTRYPHFPEERIDAFRGWLKRSNKIREKLEAYRDSVEKLKYYPYKRGTREPILKILNVGSEFEKSIQDVANMLPHNFTSKRKFRSKFSSIKTRSQSRSKTTKSRRQSRKSKI